MLDTPLGVDPNQYHGSLEGGGEEEENKEGEEEQGTYHGQGLKDRLGRAKVYLLEDSATIIHHPVQVEPEVSLAFRLLSSLIGHVNTRI